MKKLGRDFTQKEFHDLCFDFGIELDDVTSQLLQLLKEMHISEETYNESKNDPEFQKLHPQLMIAETTVLYKIDVPGMIQKI